MCTTWSTSCAAQPLKVSLALPVLRNHYTQSPCVQGTLCPQSAFREEQNSQHGKAPGSLLIYFDNCNFILIIYGQASEFSGSDPGHVFHVVERM